MLPLKGLILARERTLVSGRIHRGCSRRPAVVRWRWTSCPAFALRALNRGSRPS